jgi:hypothetical protein
MSPRNNGAGMPTGSSLAEFNSYQEAVAFVEKMLENDFPAKLVSIVGTDLKTVESIKGKLGYGRVALSGAITGSWIGMFFGLVFGATATTTEQLLLTNLAAGIVIGAGIGMLLNVIRFSLTRNRRGFISAQAVVAKKYEVIVPADQVQLAKASVAAKPNKPAKKTS